MKRAIRSVRANPPTVLSSPLPSAVGQKVSCVNLRQVTTSANKPEKSQNMEANKKMDPDIPQEKTGDVMSESFGEGYATRSDEEGYGGIYGGNQCNHSVEKGKEIHENHPAYDKAQDSEVKEKEKARHQTHVSN